MQPPVVSRVVYQGAKHLREDELSSLTGVVQGMPLNSLLNRHACTKIVQRLNDDGRPFATCELLKGGGTTDTEVVFRITEGPRMRISEIRFDGNTFVSGARLRTRIHSETKILGLGRQYHGSMVDADVVTLIRYYRDFGFHDVAVSRELQYAPDGQDLILTFHIKEGLRYQVVGVPEVIGVKSLPHEQLEAMSNLKAASYYDAKDINGVHGGGHMAHVELIGVWSKEVPGVVAVQYQVQEQQPARVGQVFIIGSEKTRQDVVSRGSSPGQIMGPSDQRTAEKRLIRLGILETNTPVNACPPANVIDSSNNRPAKDIPISAKGQ